MQNRMAIECVDRTLKVVLNSNELFCGKTVVFAGDFRQILPVGRQDGRCERMPLVFLHLTTNNAIDANRKCKSSERLFRVFEFFKSSWRRNGNEKTVKLMRFT